MEFKKVKLGEVIKVQIDNRGRNPEKYINYSKFPVIDNYLIKNEKYPNIKNVNRYIDEDTKNNFLRGHLEKDDVIITLVGNGIGNATMVPSSKCVIIQNTLGLRCNELMTNDFLYYTLISNRNKIVKYNRGSSQPSIRKTDLFSYEINVPTINYQNKITKILNSLDSKIEINNKIISNLESQAQAIFKSWFVDFEPFQDGEFVESELGMIPEGWEVKELGELFKFVKGKKPKDLHEKYEDNFIPYIVKGVMDGSETPKFTNEINIVKIKKLDCFMLMDGANSGNIYYGYDGALGSTFALLESKNQVYRELIYWKLKTNESIIKNQNTGSAIPHANKDFINKLNVAIPINIEENEILKTLENFRIKINSLNNQNTKLAELRDALLPKLMAGEIDVSNIKIEGKEVKNE